MYATVVIDIPDLSHQGFDYAIPKHLLSRVEPGVRVLVPLGSRTTEGFVLDLHSSTDVKQVRPIKEVLDLEPSFTTELIELGKWMSQYYTSHLFRTMQMLLPSALKTKIEQAISIGENEEEGQLSREELEIKHWVSENEPVKQSQLLKQFPDRSHLLKSLIKKEVLRLDKQIKNKATKKKINVVQLKMPSEQLLLEIASFPKKATKQRQILEYFLINQAEEMELAFLLATLKVTRSTVQTLIKKGYLQITEKEQGRDPYKDRHFHDKEVQLTAEQEGVLQQIIQSFQNGRKSPFLLHGVTGSGKTEIYLQVIEHHLEKGKDSIVLVPEISLTPQMVERFKGRFGSLVAVLHSRLSQGERLDEWRKIQRGEAKIVVGARSAIFAPFKDLGLIIIDEEHESSYKQEEHPKYHAREIALWRQNYHQATVILGSATPSMESYYEAIHQRYHLVELPNRVLGRALPTIHIVDMREELRKGNRSMFSHALQEKIEDRLDKKEQIVLFLNRRGYSTFVMCRSCGYVMKCPHCEISLTYHQTNHVLRCHYCGYAEHEPKNCPECGSSHIRYFGTGTQKVEEELARRFPGVRVIRMDVDTTSKKGSHEKLLTSFRKHEADILLGTQMIAKGLDFPKVTLVGVIAADTMLRLPDFRAAERTFQLLTQVGGRAGRHELAGDVVIQTYTPEHYSIQHASQHDFQSFFQQELKHREMMDYPPFRKLIAIQLSHPELSVVMKASERLVREMKALVSANVEVLGPVTAPISRIKDRYRFQCMIKYNDEPSIMIWIQQAIKHVNEALKDRQLLISIDVDPYVLM
ncbi:primosomal protein N' [Tepidibacillus decaturensis]|uniref:Replication restart protein PriA n=1 Tax=Tepidibacillus decaturensis TaxID=1413211 RepID=A0A135L457_9BACI|nr:primosomal protein N' [Tepidibacillus decaturensis]KXG43721.1 primosomal protein N' [Tepidibacillus decaturensis]